MRFFARAALAWAVTASLVVGDALNDIENTGRKQIDDYIATKSKSCTKDKLMVRKEWYAFCAYTELFSPTPPISFYLFLSFSFNFPPYHINFVSCTTSWACEIH